MKNNFFEQDLEVSEMEKMKPVSSTLSRGSPGELSRLISLAKIAKRWDCSRSSCRRILARAGVQPIYFTDRKNGLLRFEIAEVERVEREAQGAK